MNGRDECGFWVLFVTIYLIDHMRGAETTPAQKIYIIDILLPNQFPPHIEIFTRVI